ncbi:MAG: periplasmic heavy metal sensor [Chlorobiaceae bacterium]
MDFLTSKRFITAALVFLVVVNAALLGVLWWQHSCRQAYPRFHEGGRFNREAQFTGPLRLSESQATSFRTLRQAHFQQVMPEMQAIALLKKQLLEVSLAEKPDAKKIAGIASAIGARQATIERLQASHFSELAKICSPLQRDSLKTVLERIAMRRLSNRAERGRGHYPEGRGRWDAPLPVGPGR